MMTFVISLCYVQQTHIHTHIHYIETERVWIYLHKKFLNNVFVNVINPLYWTIEQNLKQNCFKKLIKNSFYGKCVFQWEVS